MYLYICHVVGIQNIQSQLGLVTAVSLVPRFAQILAFRFLSSLNSFTPMVYMRSPFLRLLLPLRGHVVSVADRIRKTFPRSYVDNKLRSRL
jgi:hypothetical protein